MSDESTGAFICGYCGSWRSGRPFDYLEFPRKGDGVVQRLPVDSACNDFALAAFSALGEDTR